MRRLLWFTVGFSAACGASIFLNSYRWVVPVAILIGLVLWFSVRKHNKSVAIFTMVLLGCTAGYAWNVGYTTCYLSDVASLDSQTKQCTLLVSDYSLDTKYGTVADAIVKENGKNYRVRVYFRDKTSVAPGMQIDGTFRFRYTVSENEHVNSYHPGYGIYLLAYQQGDLRITADTEIALRFYPAVIARFMSDTICRIFPEDTSSFAKALLLGDTSGLTYEEDTALKISGIRHVVAVSGLHISILYACLSLLTVKNRVVSTLISIPVLIFFAAMAGFTPSVTRACIMCCIMSLGKLANREYDNATALAAAVLVMQLMNPMVILSVGFQLSVASVAGIFLFYDRILKWIRSHYAKLGNRIATSVAVSVSASILTTPLCAGYFGVVSLVGVFTNLLTLWVMGFIFCGIVFACMLSIVWQGGAVAVAWVVSVPIRYVLACANLFGSIPFAAVYTQSAAVVIWLAGSYLLAMIFIVLGKRQVHVYLAVCGLGLCLVLLFSWLLPLRSDTVVSVLDVGQGQSILIQNGGKAVLIDCGGDTDEEAADLVAQTVLSRGIPYLDAVIITHCDSDHAGALPYLLTRIKTQGVFYPAVEELPELPEEVLLFPVCEDRRLSYGQTSIQLFSSGSRESGNESCLSVLFESESCAILITGDRSTLGEQLLMKRTQLPKVDILIAGHHGAASSTSEELLSTVQPDVVIISVGADNRYGHPSREVMARLETAGCRVYRTDLDGTITIRR